MSIATRITSIEEHIGDIYDTLELGGADLTNTDKNLVNVKPILKQKYLDYMNNGTREIWNNWEKVPTATGENVTLNNTVQAPMDVIVKGNSEQVQYSGKNKYKTVTSYTGYGIQVTKNDDGSITINGTASTEFNLEIINESLKAGNYTLQCKYQGTLPNISVTRCQVYSASGNFLMQIMNNASSATVVNKSLGSDVTDVKFRFLIQANFNYNNVKFYPYLVEGTYTENTMPEFEPYVGGTASPNPSYPQAISNVTGDVEVLVHNKNLAWNGWAEDFVTRINNSNQAKLETYDNRNCLFFTQNAGYNDYNNKYLYKITWKENTQYTLRCYLLNTSNPNLKPALRFVYTDDTYQDFAATTTNTWQEVIFTSTANKTIKYIQVAYYSGNRYIDLDTFMVLEGAYTSSNIPAYTPHKEQTYTFPLGTQRMYLGDYLADDGIHHVRKQVVFDGSSDENWSYYSNSGVTNRRFIIAISDMKQGTNNQYPVLCNRFLQGSNMTNDNFVFVTTSNKIVWFGSTQLENLDLAGFKEYLATNNLLLEYLLEEEEITPYTTEQQTAYNEIKQAISYNEQTNIRGSSDEDNPIFTVVALKNS